MTRCMIVWMVAAVLLATLPGCSDDGSSSCGDLLYAAAGRGAAAGDLYLVDPTDGTATSIGPIGFPIGAMAFGPGCTLWAVTAGDDGGTNGRLVRIDTTTGEGTFVALLQDATATTTYRSIAGIAFRGNVLYGWVANGGQSGGPNNQLVTIDTSTGTVTPIGPGNVFTGSWEGNGLAFAPDDTLYGSSYDGDNMLLTIDRATGIATKIANFTQNSTTPDSVKAFTFIDDVLFAIELNRAGGASLVTVDLVTAVTTPIGLLPDVSALAYAR